MAQGTTFADHIRELRTRFFAVAAVFLVATTLAYTFRDQLLDVLLGPLEGQKLLYLTPAGGFTFIFLVSVYAGFALTIPMLIYQLYSFARPALPLKSQNYGGKLLLLSLLLLIAGVLFGYYYAVPGALRFLSTFAGDYVQSALTADSYLNFIVGYTLGLGIIFQLPLILFIFHKIKPLTPSGLLKSERWVILFAFIAAAIITPTPDPLNQTIIALPVIVIYQLGVVAVLTSIRKTKRAHYRTHITKPRQASNASLPVQAPLPSQQPLQRVPAPLTRSAPRIIVSQRPTQATTQRRRTVDGFAVVSRTPNNSPS